MIKEKNKGILYILMSALFFSLMAVFVKSVPEIPLSQKMFFRNFIGLVAISVTLFRKRVSLVPNNKQLMFLRCLFGLIGVGLYYTAIAKLRLADAVILNKLSPVFVMIFAMAFLKEHVTAKQKMAMGIAIAGALLVVKPTFSIDILPGLIGVGSAMFAGAAYTVIRKLTAYDKPVLIVFYFCLFSSVVMIPFMAIQGFVIPNVSQLLFLSGIGVSALIAQLFMTTAYQHAPASEISVYTYSDTIFSLLFGMLLWRELPDQWTLLGGLCIVAAGVLNYKIQRSRL